MLALSGGIGGAKLVLGLAQVMPLELLTVVANTADDFEHLGLAISPDIDTLMYTLGGLDNPATGWGRKDETWTFMQALEALGGETWFKLGDGDLARACGAHAAAGEGREPVRHHRRPDAQARHTRAHPADVGRQSAHAPRYR